jgi:hypothetical protein
VYGKENTKADKEYKSDDKKTDDKYYKGASKKYTYRDASKKYTKKDDKKYKSGDMKEYESEEEDEYEYLQEDAQYYNVKVRRGGWVVGEAWGGGGRWYQEDALEALYCQRCVLEGRGVVEVGIESARWPRGVSVPQGRQSGTCKCIGRHWGWGTRFAMSSVVQRLCRMAAAAMQSLHLTMRSYRRVPLLGRLGFTHLTILTAVTSLVQFDDWEEAATETDEDDAMILIWGNDLRQCSPRTVGLTVGTVSRVGPWPLH